MTEQKINSLPTCFCQSCFLLWRSVEPSHPLKIASDDCYMPAQVVPKPRQRCLFIIYSFKTQQKWIDLRNNILESEVIGRYKSLWSLNVWRFYPYICDIHLRGTCNVQATNIVRSTQSLLRQASPLSTCQDSRSVCEKHPKSTIITLKVYSTITLCCCCWWNHWMHLWLHSSFQPLVPHAPSSCQPDQFKAINELNNPLIGILIGCTVIWIKLPHLSLIHNYLQLTPLRLQLVDKRLHLLAEDVTHLGWPHVHGVKLWSLNPTGRKIGREISMVRCLYYLFIQSLSVPVEWLNQVEGIRKESTFTPYNVLKSKYIRLVLYPCLWTLRNLYAKHWAI